MTPPATPPPDYYYTCGLRCVAPYWFEFTTHVKGRWVGKTVVDMFVDDFSHHSREYYEEAVAKGKIKVDGKGVAKDTVLKHNQKVGHLMHRHEQPILNKKVTILKEDERFVGVNKPPSIPVHPCGRYAKNTLVSILKAEHDFPSTLYPVHRLDKVTSGVLLFAKTAKDAENVGKLLRREDTTTATDIQKIYLARVKGHFPATATSCDYPICCTDAKKGIMRCILPSESTDDHVAKNEELLKTSAERQALLKEIEAYRKGGEGDARKRGATWDMPAKLRKKEVFKKLSDAKVGDTKLLPKPALTNFKRVGLIGEDSLVECYPKTGRTHQIRVHLKALGHPIVDDTLYNTEARSVASVETKDDASVPSFETDPLCLECSSGGEAPLIDAALKLRAAPEPGQSSMSICLHAFRYTFVDGGSKYSFEAPLPAWA